MESGSPLRLTKDPATDLGPAWSPDGRRIAFRRSLKGSLPAIWFIDPLGGTERKLVEFPLISARMSWSPDGKWLAVAAKEPDAPNGIFLLPVESGGKKELPRIRMLLTLVRHSPWMDTCWPMPLTMEPTLLIFVL